MLFFSLLCRKILVRLQIQKISGDFVLKVELGQVITFGRQEWDQIVKGLLLNLLQIIVDFALSLLVHVDWLINRCMPCMQLHIFNLSLSLV